LIAATRQFPKFEQDPTRSIEEPLAELSMKAFGFVRICDPAGRICLSWKGEKIASRRAPTSLLVTDRQTAWGGFPGAEIPSSLGKRRADGCAPIEMDI
jgi:hypothetical protein